MWTEITTVFSRILSVFYTYNWLSDTLDILLLAVVFYYILKLIRDSRAITFTKGIVFFILAYVVVLLLDMKSSIFIFKQIFNNILVILVVLFAPELRKMLERLGTGRSILKLSNLFSRNSAKDTIQYNNEVNKTVNAVCNAAEDMSEQKIGALIIFEKDLPLGEIIATGTTVDAKISSQLIGNVFYPKSPLHDGAAVIRNNRLYAAGCILPLTDRNRDVAKELGTRHRAAIGMSEQSDALVLVVSEETGAISIAQQGNLYRNLTDGEVREILLGAFLLDVPTDEEKKENREAQRLQQAADRRRKRDEKKRAKKAGKADGEEDPNGDK